MGSSGGYVMKLFVIDTEVERKVLIDVCGDLGIKVSPFVEERFNNTFAIKDGALRCAVNVTDTIPEDRSNIVWIKGLII